MTEIILSIGIPLDPSAGVTDLTIGGILSRIVVTDEVVAVVVVVGIVDDFLEPVQPVAEIARIDITTQQQIKRTFGEVFIFVPTSRIDNKVDISLENHHISDVLNCQ